MRGTAAELLRRLAPNFIKRPPAGIAQISTAEAQSSRLFPASYRAFLLEANGGEGPIGDHGYLQLWNVEELCERASGYGFLTYVPNLVPIGSDGAGEAIVIDLRNREASFGYFPFIGLEFASFIGIDSDFWETLRKVGEGSVFSRET